MIRKGWKGESTRAAMIAALGVVMAAPAVSYAAAAGACVPPVTGAPWAGTAPSVTDVSALGGVQWTGSFGFDWQAGSTQKADFKFVVQKGSSVATEAGYLYFYWRQNINVPSVSDDDGVRFGFTAIDPTSGSKVAQVYTIHMQGNSAAPTRLTAPKVNPPSAVSAAERIGFDDPKALTTAPTWLTQPEYVNTWLIPAPDAPDGSPQFTWAITARIPIKKMPDASTNGGSILQGGDLYDVTTAGVFLDTNVVNPGTLTVAPETRIWSDLLWTPGAGTQTVLHYPDDIDGSVLPTDGSPPVPVLSAFNSAQLVGPMDSLCSNGGVYITQDDIAVTGGSWAGDLHAYTSTGSPADNNVLVQVHNKGGVLTATDAGKIHATFRIAPLGSQTVKSNLWRELNNLGNKIQFTCPTPTTCGPALVTPNTPLVGNLDAASMNTTAIEQTFNLKSNMAWTPDWSYICATYFDADPPGTPNGHFTAEYGYTRFPTNCAGSAAPWKPTLTPPSDGLGSHQCMLVELSATDNRQFNQQSAFRNMHLGHASTFREAAVIDSSGLKRLGNATGRYIYLYVETRNMPEVYVAPPDDGNPSLRSKISMSNGLVYNSERQRITYDQAASFMPTMSVHVYNDTGRTTLSLKKKKMRVLEQQSSYGFFIEHQGELHGWRKILAGAERVAPNFYRVWVKNDKAVAVTNIVEAREKECSGYACDKTTRLLHQLESYLAQVGSPFKDDVNALLKQKQIGCLDLSDLIAEIKVQPGLECIGGLLGSILEASSCHCD